MTTRKIERREVRRLLSRITNSTADMKVQYLAVCCRVAIEQHGHKFTAAELFALRTFKA
jgi:hypothetical protein